MTPLIDPVTHSILPPHLPSYAVIQPIGRQRRPAERSGSLSRAQGIITDFIEPIRSLHCYHLDVTMTDPRLSGFISPGRRNKNIADRSPVISEAWKMTTAIGISCKCTTQSATFCQA